MNKSSLLCLFLYLTFTWSISWRHLRDPLLVEKPIIPKMPTSNAGYDTYATFCNDLIYASMVRPCTMYVLARQHDVLEALRASDTGWVICVVPTLPHVGPDSRPFWDAETSGRSPVSSTIALTQPLIIPRGVTLAAPPQPGHLPVTLAPAPGYTYSHLIQLRGRFYEPAAIDSFILDCRSTVSVAVDAVGAARITRLVVHDALVRAINWFGDGAVLLGEVAAVRVPQIYALGGSGFSCIADVDAWATPVPSTPGPPTDATTTSTRDSAENHLSLVTRGFTVHSGVVSGPLTAVIGFSFVDGAWALPLGTARPATPPPTPGTIGAAPGPWLITLQSGAISSRAVSVFATATDAAPGARVVPVGSLEGVVGSVLGVPPPNFDDRYQAPTQTSPSPLVRPRPPLAPAPIVLEAVPGVVGAAGRTATAAVEPPQRTSWWLSPRLATITSRSLAFGLTGVMVLYTVPFYFLHRSRKA